MCREATGKRLNIDQNAVNSTTTGKVVQLVQKTQVTVTKYCLLLPPLVVIQPYLLLNLALK